MIHVVLCNENTWQCEHYLVFDSSWLLWPHSKFSFREQGYNLWALREVSAALMPVSVIGYSHFVCPLNTERTSINASLCHWLSLLLPPFHNGSGPVIPASICSHLCLDLIGFCPAIYLFPGSLLVDFCLVINLVPVSICSHLGTGSHRWLFPHSIFMPSSAQHGFVNQ